jgi:hypothetical protein
MHDARARSERPREAFPNRDEAEALARTNPKGRLLEYAPTTVGFYVNAGGGPT